GGPVSELVAGNAEVEKQIRTMSRHGAASQILEGFEAQSTYRLYPLVLPERSKESFAEVDDMVKSIVAGDAQLAREKAEQHIQSVIEAVNRASTRDVENHLSGIRI
ncbi:hypothetical protein, partial [Pseudarthrobacter sp. YAF2]|uniref:hypothetical protein n=1 Tax=Pseudarthrobacter sp. YAF2 TaxID=3233078 RepID=UPI003F9AB056